MACLGGFLQHKRKNKIKFTFGINNIIFFSYYLNFLKKNQFSNVALVPRWKFTNMVHVPH
jgi:hypothetical protein